MAVAAEATRAPLLPPLREEIAIFRGPAALDGSRWVDCDLDTTVWPSVLRDITIVDSSLRNSVWEMETGENIRIMGTKRIPIQAEPRTDDVVADISVDPEVDQPLRRTVVEGVTGRLDTWHRSDQSGQPFDLRPTIGELGVAGGQQHRDRRQAGQEALPADGSA